MPSSCCSVEGVTLRILPPPSAAHSGTWIPALGQPAAGWVGRRKDTGGFRPHEEGEHVGVRERAVLLREGDMRGGCVKQEWQPALSAPVVSAAWTAFLRAAAFL